MSGYNNNSYKMICCENVMTAENQQERLELKRDNLLQKIGQNIFRFQKKDFIPVYGLMRYAERNTIALDEHNPSRREWVRCGFNNLTLLAYNFSVLYFVPSILEKVLE